MTPLEILLLIGLVAACIAVWRTRSALHEYKLHFAKIASVEDELSRIFMADRKRRDDLQKERDDLQDEITQLKSSYREKKEIFDDLVFHVSLYDEQIELIELGFYKPHYEFDTSDEYKIRLEAIREQQKAMIKSKAAIVCQTEWTINGSKRQGSTMTNRGIRLTARAFNNECEAAISNTRWNNAERMQGRILKAFESINLLNESSKIYISTEYLDLKLGEFRLAHEYQVKKQQEREEQAAIRQQMREEAKLEQELEAAVREEERQAKMLEKFKKEAEKATGEKLAEYESRVSELEAALRVAHEKSERAKSMAQQTKAGHVYVISNVGSFGSNVYKIGMTRRLEPDDRVRELGDASVPFVFDTHAMIYTENAPELENKLHKALEAKRVNLVNSRKEFFNVSLDEVESLVRQYSPKSTFIKIAEAREYQESEAIRAQLSARLDIPDVRTRFAPEI